MEKPEEVWLSARLALWLTPKLGCGSEIKANAALFALYSARLALTLQT